MPTKRKQRSHEDAHTPDWKTFQAIGNGYRDLRRAIGQRRATRYLDLQEGIIQASIASHRKEIASVKDAADYDLLYQSIADFAIECIRADVDVTDLFDDDETALDLALNLTLWILPSWVVFSPANPARLVPA